MAPAPTIAMEMFLISSVGIIPDCLSRLIKVLFPFLSFLLFWLWLGFFKHSDDRVYVVAVDY